MTTRTAVRRVVPAAVAAAAVVALVALVPASVHTSWQRVGALVGTLSGRDLLLLTGLWLAGLLAHTVVMRASMPGLTTARALLLNLTGSAVANVLPLGGAAGIGANFLMARTWGFSRAAFGVFTAVSNLAVVLGKLVTAALGLTLVIAGGALAAWPPGLGPAAVASVAVVLPLLLVVTASGSATRYVGLAGDRVVAAAARAVGSGRRTGMGRTLPALRTDSARVVRGRWAQLGGGTAAYLVLQGTLLWACVHVLGGSPGVMVVLGALAVERLLTLLPVTPSGAGVVEAGTVAALVAMGTDPVLAAGSVLVYRTFTFLLEIPVGGTALVLWTAARRRPRVSV